MKNIDKQAYAKLIGNNVVRETKPGVFYLCDQQGRQREGLAGKEVRELVKAGVIRRSNPDDFLSDCILADQWKPPLYGHEAGSMKLGRFTVGLNADGSLIILRGGIEFGEPGLAVQIHNEALITIR